MMWRHGDIMIASVAAIPNGAERRPTSVLAWGEVTGHSHRIEEVETAEILELQGVMYLNVTSALARLVHQEHQPITLPRGTYRFWYQREYSPEAIRRIVD